MQVVKLSVFNSRTGQQNEEDTKLVGDSSCLVVHFTVVIYLSPQGRAILKGQISSWIGKNIFLFQCGYFPQLLQSDPKQLPVWCKINFEKKSESSIGQTSCILLGLECDVWYTRNGINVME